jgi:hypothetical protein
MKINEKVYMELRNLQQQVGEWAKVYYEHLLQVTNCLHVRTINVFITTIFRTSLLPYLTLATKGMKGNTFMEHKEAIVICEENGPVV